LGGGGEDAGSKGVNEGQEARWIRTPRRRRNRWKEGLTKANVATGYARKHSKEVGAVGSRKGHLEY